MLLYRLSKTKYARDTSGEGARLYGARWNHVGTPYIYTSQTKSLALLEYTVNVNVEDIPRALSFTTFEIPDSQIYSPAVSQLPRDWKNLPAPVSTPDFGTKLLQAGDHLIIRLPSVIINTEWNYLLNPLHAKRSRIKVVDVSEFEYDVRIKHA